MSATLGIVQVRPDLPGLREKLSRRIGGHSLLELVVRRVTDCQQLEDVAVVLGSRDVELAELVPPDVLLHVSDRADMLGQIASAADDLGAGAVVRVGAEHPFVDPFLIDRLATTAEAHPHCDYIGFCTRSGRPTILTGLESFGEWCRADALGRADRAASSAVEREHATHYLCAHPESFRLRFVPLPSELERGGARLAWDGEEAWEHALTLHDALGHEHVSWRKLAELLERLPSGQSAATQILTAPAGG